MSLKDRDDFSSTAIIAGGTALNLTVEDVSVDPDTQIIMTLWFYPANL
jgi:hypothetical protein